MNQTWICHRCQKHAESSDKANKPWRRVKILRRSSDENLPPLSESCEELWEDLASVRGGLGRLSSAARLGSRPRAGVAMVLVLICLVVMTASIGTMLRTLVLINRQSKRQAHTTQANWLADSGIQRAAIMRRVDPQYTGETWSVTAEDWGARLGKVEIQVRVDPDDQGLAEVSVVATFPHDNQFAVKARREATIMLAPAATTDDPTTGDEEDDNR